MEESSLPRGWKAEWDARHKEWSYTDTYTGQSPCNRPSQPAQAFEPPQTRSTELAWSCRQEPVEPECSSREKPIEAEPLSWERPTEEAQTSPKRTKNRTGVVPNVGNRPHGNSNVRNLYETLHDPKSIRLLELEQGSRTDPLRGTLWQRESIEQCLSYEALSYRWSDVDPNNPALIEIDGIQFPVGPELHAALIQFRRHGMTRLFWIDQICINQDDAEEKIRQVQIMGDIYSKAESVLIWLGEARDESDMVMEGFPMLVEQIQRDDERAKLRKPSEIPRDISEHRGALATPLNSLLSRPWFGRVWTLQEAALGQRGEVWCGQKSFPFHVLEIFEKGCNGDQYGYWGSALSMIGSGSGSKDPENPNRPVLAHLHIVSNLKSGVTSSASLLNSIRSLDCSQDRDRIYSVLWFLSPDLVKSIVRKSDPSVAELYHLIAIHEIQRGELEYFGAAGLSQHRISYDMGNDAPSPPCLLLPSWVPDWMYKIRTHSYWVQNRELLRKRGVSLFDAGESPLDKYVCSFSDDYKILFVKGFIIDEVDECAPSFRIQRTPRDPSDIQASISAFRSGYEGIQTYIASCLELARRCSSHYGLSNIDRACKHCLVGGMMPEGRTTSSTGLLVRATNEAVDELFEEFETMISDYEEIEKLGHRLQTGSLTAAEGSRMLEIASGIQNRGDISKRNNLVQAMAEACKGRRFFITAARSRYMGVAPDITRAGDKICVIPGCCAPFVIRPTGNRYQLIGECYVEGLMHGEIMKRKEVSAETIALE